MMFTAAIFIIVQKQNKIGKDPELSSNKSWINCGILKQQNTKYTATHMTYTNKMLKKLGVKEYISYRSIYIKNKNFNRQDYGIKI